jgi:chloramphenicol-sensitive protein RarD
MTEAGKGILAMIVACTIWGISPIYYKELSHVPALEVLSHRIWWSLVFFAGALALQSRLGELVRVLRNKRTATLLVVSSIMVTTNWFLFILGIQLGRTTETSLGYYIYPLVAILIGRFVFSERLDLAQWSAVALATAAVSILTFGLGVTPWISLILAITFGLYGLIKKRLDIGPVVSVTCEILFFIPLALGLLVVTHAQGQGAFGQNLQDTWMLILSGPITGLPLILFSYAARRIAMTTLGLLQYLNPSLQFFCAVVIFSEPFGPWHAIAFPLIWLALAVYSVSSLRQDHAARKAASASAGVSTEDRKPASEASANP